MPGLSRSCRLARHYAMNVCHYNTGVLKRYIKMKQASWEPLVTQVPNSPVLLRQPQLSLPHLASILWTEVPLLSRRTSLICGSRPQISLISRQSFVPGVGLFVAGPNRWPASLFWPRQALAVP